MRRWTEQTSSQLGELARDGAIAILPVAAVEQHGPHLPLGTDAFILEGVLDRLEWSGPGEVLELPLQAVGHSLEHTAYPGTLHVEAEALLSKWTGLGRAVCNAGVMKLMILNSHGGQPQLVDLVALRLRQEYGMLVTRVNTFALGTPDGLFEEDELRNGLHGGEVETSMMLALRPDLVVTEALRDFPNAMRSEDTRYEALGAEEPVGFAWAAQDLNAEGVTGAAAKADAERGARLLDHLAARVAAVLRDMGAFPIEDLRDPPSP